MKKQIEVMIVFSIFLMLIPCISFIGKNQNRISHTTSDDTVSILFTENNKIAEISLEDYMVGAVLAQMPADFEEEALKAQAILSHTYILRRQMSEQANPTKQLKGAFISDDASHYQSYFTPEQAKKFYGSEYETVLKKVTDIVKSVKNQILTYDNEPIIVAFHAVSGGATESAKNMWGEDIPYLISVNSSWDKKVESNEKTTAFSSDELEKKLSEAFPDIDHKLNDKSIRIEKATDIGSVLKININGETLSGTDFTAALSLPSPCFTIDFKNDTYTVKTKGYGHLVGMSQYGANYMAKDGKTYEEILSHYFPHTTLKDY